MSVLARRQECRCTLLVECNGADELVGEGTEERAASVSHMTHEARSEHNRSEGQPTKIGRRLKVDNVQVRWMQDEQR